MIRCSRRWLSVRVCGRALGRAASSEPLAEQHCGFLVAGCLGVVVVQRRALCFHATRVWREQSQDPPPTSSPDPEELRRERELRKKMIENPQMFFARDPSKFEKTPQQQQQQQQQPADQSTPVQGQSSRKQDDTTGGGPRRPFPRPSQSVSMVELMALMIVAYGAFQLLKKAQGGDFTSLMVPFWACSIQDQAKHTIFLLSFDKNQRELYRNQFLQARRANPMLPFFDFMDAVAPWWCSGRRHGRESVLGGLTEALRSLSMMKIAALSQRLSRTGKPGPNADHGEVIDRLADSVCEALPMRSLAAGPPPPAWGSGYALSAVPGYGAGCGPPVSASAGIDPTPRGQLTPAGLPVHPGAVNPFAGQPHFTQSAEGTAPPSAAPPPAFLAPHGHSAAAGLHGSGQPSASSRAESSVHDSFCV